MLICLISFLLPKTSCKNKNSQNVLALQCVSKIQTDDSLGTYSSNCIWPPYLICSDWCLDYFTNIPISSSHLCHSFCFVVFDFCLMLLKTLLDRSSFPSPSTRMLTSSKRPQGKPKTTWIAIFQKELLNSKWSSLIETGLKKCWWLCVKLLMKCVHDDKDDC